MKLLKILEAHNANPNLLSSGQIKCKCPFRELHQDGSGQESMFLTPERNVYHCFSCKSAGKLTVLLSTEYEVPLFEAIEMVHIDEYIKEKKKSLENDDYYWDLALPKVFAKRGFTKELLVDKFRVGVSGNKTVIPKYWDGELRGITYRIDEIGKNKKVWNTEGFNKEEYLYNGDARYTDYVILVEGESDLYRLISWGYNAYATLGTSLSEWQVKHICKTPKVYIASDCDLPGVVAAEKWYKQLHLHTEVVFINYEAPDPDTANQRIFNRAFRNPISYVEFRLLTEPEEE